MDKKIIAELGQVAGIRRKIAGGTFSNGQAKYTAEPLDLNSELAFPACLPIYGVMQNTSKVGGILQAIILRITSMSWNLTGNKVRPEVLEFVKEQVGLSDPGAGRVRHSSSGVSLIDHLELALSCLVYGFAPFEQVYTIGAPVTPAEKALGRKWVTRIRKLGYRDPSTIAEIGVGEDGGLQEIVQRGTDSNGSPVNIVLDVNRLVVYTSGRKGGDWYGKSILRGAYRDWYFLDMLERLHAQIVERNGMGLPVFKYDPTQMTAQDAEEIVTNIRAGESAGIWYPMGQGELTLQGVTGGTVDPLPAIQRHEQNIGKSMLAMFMDLGHDAGARSLGDTFTALFDSALNTYADRFAETFTEHVIADLVALNFGTAEPYPELAHGAAAATIGADAATLVDLAGSGFITPNAADEAALRGRLGLPTEESAPIVRENQGEDAGNTPAAGAGLSQRTPTDQLLDRAATMLKEAMNHEPTE